MSTDQEQKLIVDQSEVEWLILADEAEVVNGKLYMIGGGWDRLTAGTLPCQQHMAIALAVRVPWTATNRQTSVDIILEDDDGSSLVDVRGEFIVGRPPQAVPGQPLRSQIAIKMDVSLPRLGTYAVVCRLLDNEKRFPFSVMASPELASQLQNQAGGLR